MWISLHVDLVAIDLLQIRLDYLVNKPYYKTRVRNKFYNSFKRHLENVCLKTTLDCLNQVTWSNILYWKYEINIMLFLLLKDGSFIHTFNKVFIIRFVLSKQAKNEN